MPSPTKKNSSATPTQAGHLILTSKSRIAPNLRAINPQSVLVTLRALKDWRANRKYVSGRVLDVGCGNQPYRLLCDGQYAQWIGLDRNLPTQKGFPLSLKADAQHLPFPAKCFDTILAAEVLEHLPQPELFWSEIARVLKPQGHLLLSTPFLYWIHEAPYDYHRFTRHGLQSRCTRAGLEILQISPRGGILIVFCDLLFKGISGLFGMANKILCCLSSKSAKPSDLRRSFLGNLLLAWPQALLSPLLQNETISADTITAGYMLVARKKEDDR